MKTDDQIIEGLVALADVTQKYVDDKIAVSPSAIDALADRVLISARGYVDARATEQEASLIGSLKILGQRLDETTQRLAAIENQIDAHRKHLANLEQRTKAIK